MAKKIGIVSGGGRGAILALELVQLGFEVSFLDVTKFLGPSPPEETQGPFGYFDPKNFSETQKALLDERGFLQTSRWGFSFLGGKRPYHLKGPLTSFYLKKGFLRERTEDGKIPEGSFEKNWPFHLFAQSFSTHFEEHPLKDPQIPFSFLSDYSFLRVNRSSLIRTVEFLKEKGIEVYEEEFVSLGFEKKSLKSIYLPSRKLVADHWVWTLTGEEIHSISSSVGSFLYPQGAPQSKWSWILWRFFLDGEWVSHLPYQFLVLFDPFLPWTHENLCWMQKSEKKGEICAWMRVPSSKRFNTQYLDDLLFKVQGKLKQRIPGFFIKKVQKPQEYLYHDRSWAPFFPLYEKKDCEKKRPGEFKNVSFENFETRSFYRWEYKPEEVHLVVKSIEKKLLEKRK